MMIAFRTNSFEQCINVDFTNKTIDKHAVWAGYGVVELSSDLELEHLKKYLKDNDFKELEGKEA